ncbi:MAG: hypothetical protein RXO43_03615 [Candidatus Micrarchaeota archaeon]
MKADKLTMDLYNYIMKAKKQDFLNPKSPYANGYMLKCGGKELAVIGGNHKANDKRIRSLISNAFKLLKPKVVLLEQPKDLDVEALKKAVKHTDKKFWNEFDVATDLAVRNEAKIYFIDISNKERFEFFMQLKDGIKLYILELFSAIYNINFHTYNKIRMMEPEDYKILSEALTLRDIIDDEQIYNAFIKMKQKEYKNLSLIATIDKIIDQMAKKYTGQILSQDLLLSRALTAPFPYSDYKINKINAKHEALRDSSMIKVIINYMKRNDSVMVVCGSGHASIFKKHLIKKAEIFGKCKVEEISY